MISLTLEKFVNPFNQSFGFLKEPFKEGLFSPTPRLGKPSLALYIQMYLSIGQVPLLLISFCKSVLYTMTFILHDFCYLLS